MQTAVDFRLEAKEGSRKIWGAKDVLSAVGEQWPEPYDPQ